MAYTKTQLVEAFCLATGWTAESEKTKAEWASEQITRIQEGIDARISRIGTAQDRAKQIALEYLSEQERLSAENITL